MLKVNTLIYMITTFEYKLSLALSIDFIPHYSVTEQSKAPDHLSLIIAICHQNLIGWDNFLRGFTSIYWNDLYQQAHAGYPSTPNPQWDVTLVAESVNLSQQIWYDRNSHLHGTSTEMALQLKCERVLEQVRQIYKRPPSLHSRFKPVTNIPIKTRLARTTTNLQRWISRIDQQKKETKFLVKTAPQTQMSLMQSIRRANIDIFINSKSPP
jgi:hypothetical protein